MKSIMKFLAPALILCFIAVSCGSRKSSVQNQREIILPTTSLYNYDEVEKAAKDVPDVNVKYGNKLFLKAIDLYHNKHELDKGIAMFKKSLNYYPSPRAFYELGNALLDKRSLKEASDAFNMAGVLDYDPSYNISYKQACIDALKNDSTAIGSLESALREGYSDKEEILREPAFATLRKNPDFEALMLSNFSSAKDGLDPLFAHFRGRFPSASLPYSILENPETAYSDNRTISYDYASLIEGMEDGRYSRDVTDNYSFTAQVMKSDSITILAYSTETIVADTLPPVKTFLATYDKNGKYIDKLEFACRCSPDEFKTGTLGTDLKAEIKSYRNVWQNDPREKGYKDNTVARKELLYTEYYIMDKSGHFRRVEAPAPVQAQAPAPAAPAAK
jgi:tetratricopeptide (TPR) repeat protein